VANDCIFEVLTKSDWRMGWFAPDFPRIVENIKKDKIHFYRKPKPWDNIEPQLQGSGKAFSKSCKIIISS
jgi:hypothetical protein